MGGSLSALLACQEPSLGAAVVFYGFSKGGARGAAAHSSRLSSCRERPCVPSGSR